MENDTDTPGAASPGFTLDNAICVNGKEEFPAGTRISLRKPGGGELRGVMLTTLVQLDYASIETVAPRITTPRLLKHHIAAMDPADLMQMGGEIVNFFLTSRAKREVYLSA